MTKYKIEGFTVDAKRPLATVKSGDIEVYNPEYPEVEIPDDAIGITTIEEILLAVPPNTPQPPPGLESVVMESIRKKYTHALCRIRYLVPVK